MTDSTPVAPDTDPTSVAPDDVPADDVPDTNTETVVEEPVEEKRYDLPSGSVVYVNDDGNTCVETSNGSLTVVEGDNGVYETVVALATLFPERF